MHIKHALVVDDSKSARFSLKKLLQKQGIKADFAESAGDALNYLESNKPDVIFMDHLMPGMDGFEAAKAIKANPDTNDIPIIMCTSKEGSEYAEQAMAHGAIAILPKPAPEATLTAVLNQLHTKIVPAVNADGTEDTTATQKEAAPAAAGAYGQRAIEGLVKKLIEEQLGQIRKTVESSVEKIITDQLEAKMISTRERLKEDVSRSIEPTIHDSVNKVGQKVAAELFDNRFEELKKSVLDKVNGELNTFRSDIEKAKKPSPELMEEVKNVAQFTAAHTAAEDISRNIAQDVAQEELVNLKEELLSQFKAELDGATSSSKMFGIIAMVLAMVAIALPFVM